VHRALDASSAINEPTNERTATVGTAIFNSVDDTVQVEKSDLNTIKLYEFASTGGKFIKPTGFDPILRHR